MTPDITLQLAAIVAPVVGSAVVGLLVWSLRRNVQSLDQAIGEIRVDMRTLASQTTQHGSALAGGVVKFQTIERRLDGLEDRERVREKECATCQRLRIEDQRG
jgi:hypothetical protein